MKVRDKLISKPVFFFNRRTIILSKLNNVLGYLIDVENTLFFYSCLHNSYIGSFTTLFILTLFVLYSYTGSVRKIFGLNLFCSDLGPFRRQCGALVKQHISRQQPPNFSGVQSWIKNLTGLGIKFQMGPIQHNILHIYRAFPFARSLLSIKYYLFNRITNLVFKLLIHTKSYNNFSFFQALQY